MFRLFCRAALQRGISAGSTHRSPAVCLALVHRLLTRKCSLPHVKQKLHCLIFTSDTLLSVRVFNPFMFRGFFRAHKNQHAQYAIPQVQGNPSTAQ